MYINKEVIRVMTKREIADTFRRMRRSSGLTQQELADRLGKKQQTVGHWETGYAQPDIGTLLELFGVYHKSFDEEFLCAKRE